jgi:hypothetical protein
MSDKCPINFLNFSKVLTSFPAAVLMKSAGKHKRGRKNLTTDETQKPVFENHFTSDKTCFARNETHLTRDKTRFSRGTTKNSGETYSISQETKKFSVEMKPVTREIFSVSR